MAQGTFLAVIRDAVPPGLAFGLFAPTLITQEVTRYLPLLLVSIPAGLIIAWCFCRALRTFLTRRCAAASGVDAAMAYIIKPFMLLALGCAVFVFSVPAIPFFIAAAVIGTVYYRIFSVMHRLCNFRLTTLECAGLLIPFIASFALLFQVNIVHDAFQYLCIVVSLVKDFDLNFYNEGYLLNSLRSHIPIALHSARYLGVPVLEAPFFAAGELLDRVMQWAGSYHIPNGMTFPYLFMVSLASPLFGLGALLLIYRLCREFFPRSTSLLATIGYFFASPLIFFTFCWNGWPHPFNTFFIALFLLYEKRTLGKKQITDWIALGGIGGLLCLIRPTNAILALFPLFEVAADYRQKRALRSVAFKGPLAGALAAVLVFSPQLTIWKCTGGKFLGGPYQEVGDYFDWLHPNFFGTLLATSQHGLFAWSPLLLPAALGLLLFFKKDRVFGSLSIILCILHTYIYSSWSVWWTGIGFSNRFFVELSPLFVLGLASLIEKAEQRKLLAQDTLVALFSLFAVWNLFLIGEYRANIVPYSIPDPARVIDKPLTMGAIIYKHLFVFPLQAGSLFTTQWGNENFFFPRLIHALTYKRPVEGFMLIFTAAACALAFYLLARALLASEAGKVLRRRLHILLWVAGASVVLLHMMIVGAYHHTIPFSRMYHFETSDKVIKQPAEDTWFYSTYHHPVIQIDLLTYLIYGHGVRQEEAVALVSVYDRADRRFDYVLRAGIDTAEYSYLRPESMQVIEHTVTQSAMVREIMTTAYSRYLYSATTYCTHLQLPEPVTIKKIGVRYLKDDGALIISDIFMRDF